jgi:hypothetical protein
MRVYPVFFRSSNMPVSNILIKICQTQEGAEKTIEDKVKAVDGAVVEDFMWQVWRCQD